MPIVCTDTYVHIRNICVYIHLLTCVKTFVRVYVCRGVYSVGDHVDVYVRARINVYRCVHVCRHVCVYLRMCCCMHLCVRTAAHVYACARVCKYMYVHMHVYVYIRMC